MKISSKVRLVLLPAFAAAFMAGCDSIPDEQYTRACLDPQGNTVEVQKCESMYKNNGQTDNGYWFYYWYYMNGNHSYPVGARVIVAPGHGTFIAPEGSSFGAGASVGIVSRGGFGGIGEGAVGE
jgi:hypothetical protein